MKTLEEQIRELARSQYWQDSFHASKECNMHLFENITNLSGLQLRFLYWLSTYSMLYKELYTKEWDILDEAMINDNDRCDAFLLWRQKQQEIIIKENKKIREQNEASGKKEHSMTKTHKIWKGKK